jgi:prephenate dehydratase
MNVSASRPGRIGFLGPRGTFTEEALVSQASLREFETVPLPSFVDVMSATEDGLVDLGFLAIENSIEGTVNVTVDQLIFERDLLIRSEAILEVTQNLIAHPGVALEEIKRVVSFPHATAQCRRWLAAALPGVEEVGASSTADAVRLLSATEDRETAAIGTRLAAELYNLDVLAPDIADHGGNATRFVLVSPSTAAMPAPTGHDKTSIVCFQLADQPGNLHGILGQFSARNLNLTKLESRPTKQGLGSYCFLIDVEGHIADEVMADCLRELHATLPALKFLGSYPAAGDDGPGIRRDATSAWKAADLWVKDLRSRIESGGIRSSEP